MQDWEIHMIVSLILQSFILTHYMKNISYHIYNLHENGFFLVKLAEKM